MSDAQEEELYGGLTATQEGQRLLEQGWRPLPSGEGLIHGSITESSSMFGGSGPLRSHAPRPVADAMRDIQRALWATEQQTAH